MAKKNQFRDETGNFETETAMYGGHYGGYSYSDEILEFNPLTGQWELVDRMIQARSYNALSAINFESKLCV